MVLMRQRLHAGRLHRRLPSLLCLALFALPALANFAWAGEVRGQVTDEAGLPLPARIFLLEPQTRQSQVVYAGLDGQFAIQAPDGKLQMVVRHGPEWTIAELEVTAGQQVTVQLRRVADMPVLGYFSADFHMHSTFSDGKQTPTQVALACRAEGLHLGALSDHGSVAQQPEWLATAAPGWLPLRGQEITTKAGHILGLGTTEFISPDTSNGADDTRRIFRAIHAQGGIAIVAHPNAPGMTYLTPEVHDYDALEILNGSLPPYGSVFDFVQGRKAWQSQLWRGGHIAALGNSDNHDVLSGLARELLRDPEAARKRDKRIELMCRMVDVDKVIIPWGYKGLHPGTYRTYLKLPALTAAAVYAAVKAGNGFVTNGPLLPATLDGQAPGSEMTLGDRKTLVFHAQPRANRPLERMDILVNGAVRVSLTAPVPAEVELPLDLKPGDCVLAELYGVWPEFATTNAWYIK